MRDPRVIHHRPARNVPTIYGLKDPRHGMFCYVGQTVDLEARYLRHLDGRIYDGNYSKAVWMADMSAAGVRPELVVLETCENVQSADAAEREWIRRLIEEDHPILNVAAGGSGIRGASKFGSARKRDWMELGYLMKCASDATLQSGTDLSGFLPKNAKELRLIKKAHSTLRSAMSLLEARIRAEYPRWEDFTKVFYGAAEDHLLKLGSEHAAADIEARQHVMTTDDIRAIMDRVPELNAHGIGLGRGYGGTVEQCALELNKGRRELLESVNACNKVCRWLADIERTSGINERVGASDRLKKKAERDIGYVTNGAFITAAIFCGFKHKIQPESINVLFGMSSRSLRSKEREAST